MIGKLCTLLAILTWLVIFFTCPAWLTYGYIGYGSAVLVAGLWSAVYTCASIRFDRSGM